MHDRSVFGPVDSGRVRSLLLTGTLWLMAGCSTDDVVAVGSAGGVYQPGGSCTREEGGGAQCGDLVATYRFEQASNHGFTLSLPEGSEPDTAADLRVSCARSYCGTGALATDVRFRWPASRLLTLQRSTESSQDLNGKTLYMQVLVEPMDTPMNAQIAIIHAGRWRMVAWNVLRPGWNVIAGVVAADNPLLDLAGHTGPITASSVLVEVFLATELRNGRDRWEGQVYVDEIGWR